MGFAKEDLVGHVPFEYHHHEDVGANVQCSKGCKWIEGVCVFVVMCVYVMYV